MSSLNHIAFEMADLDAVMRGVGRLRDHGITPGFVNHAKARGYNTTDPDEWIRLRNTGLRDR